MKKNLLVTRLSIIIIYGTLFLNSCITADKNKPGLDQAKFPALNNKSKSDLMEIDTSIKNDIASNVSREMNVLKNGDMAERKGWRLHQCEWTKLDNGENVIVFNSPNKEFKKVWQRVPFAPKPGTKVSLSAVVKTAPFDIKTPYPEVPKWLKPTLFITFYAEDGKTRLFTPK
jgi:hypothetical protein